MSKRFNYSSQILSVATKVFVNQLVMAPTFNTYFFSMQALLAGDRTDQISYGNTGTDEGQCSRINACLDEPAVLLQDVNVDVDL